METYLLSTTAFILFSSQAKLHRLLFAFTQTEESSQRQRQWQRLRNSDENGSDDALRLRRWLRVGGDWSSSLTAMASFEAEQPASTSSVLRGGIRQRRRLPPPLLSGELVVAGDSDGLFLLRRRRNVEFDGGLCQRVATAEHPSPLQRDGGGGSMVGTPRVPGGSATRFGWWRQSALSR
nr:hypothetical protein Iba_chr06cCG10800 [Ipomoea batatas]